LSIFPCQGKLARVDDNKLSIFPCQGKLARVDAAYSGLLCFARAISVGEVVRDTLLLAISVRDSRDCSIINCFVLLMYETLKAQHLGIAMKGKMYLDIGFNPVSRRHLLPALTRIIDCRLFSTKKKIYFILFWWYCKGAIDGSLSRRLIRSSSIFNDLTKPERLKFIL